MARGNCIVVESNPNKGVFTEGIIAAGETPKPGTIMQRDATVALQGGRHTYNIYNRDADGDRPKGAIWILREDNLQGKTITDAYAAGDRAFLYAPAMGEEVNVLVKDTAGTGTGSNPNKGDIMSIDDGSGKLIPEAGESGPFLLLEDADSAAADDLCWCEFGGF